MLQALHDKCGHPSNSKFIQIYKEQNRVGFPANFLALLNQFRCKVSLRFVPYVRALEGSVAALVCNYTDRTRHLRLFLPQVTFLLQVTLFCVVPTTIRLLVA